MFDLEGTSEYTTCSGLLDTSSSTWPESALFQIVANGVSEDKLVIGKPATTGDASSGYMSPSTLATCVEDAKNEGWGMYMCSFTVVHTLKCVCVPAGAGVMVWQVCYLHCENASGS